MSFHRAVLVAVALTLLGVVPTHANAGTTLDFSYSANGTFLDPGAVPWTVTGSGSVTFTNNPTSVADSFDFAWTSSYDGNMFHFDANTLQNFSISGATISFLTTSVQKIGGGGDFEDLQSTALCPLRREPSSIHSRVSATWFRGL